MTQFENPFPLSEPLHHALWERFIRFETMAFANCDWDAMSELYDEDSFIGLDPILTEERPEHWKNVFPNLAAFKEHWMQFSAELRAIASAEVVASAGLAGSKIAKVEWKDRNTVLLHKHYDIALPKADGGVMTFRGSNIFVLRLFDGEWKVISFLGGDEGASAANAQE